MAWNYYPPIPEDAQHLPPRLHAHADMDVLTLLHQRPEDRGLEIAPGKEVDSVPWSNPTPQTSLQTLHLLRATFLSVHCSDCAIALVQCLGQRPQQVCLSAGVLRVSPSSDLGGAN